MKLLVLSDIHANLTALQAVFSFVDKQYGLIPTAVLGDNIDYGMRPNDVLDMLLEKHNQIIVNLSGNHEQAILGKGVNRFSTQRGEQASRYTSTILKDEWKRYFQENLSDSPVEMELEGLKFLFVHGDLSDLYWGKMSQAESMNEHYKGFDYVFSGHTHIQFLREEFYADESLGNLRGRKKTVFINPGAVGQPRNHNPRAQFVVLDIGTRSVCFHALDYDIEHELLLYNDDKIDYFYGERLKFGI